MASIRTTALWIIALAAATSLYAQDPVPHLQDLKGARGRDGEYQMQQRGYTHVRTEKSDDSAYSFWTDNRTGKCVQVRTTDGRYASIVYSPEADCHSENGGESIGVETEDRFDTLCGFTGTGDGPGSGRSCLWGACRPGRGACSFALSLRKAGWI